MMMEEKETVATSVGPSKPKTHPKNGASTTSLYMLPSEYSFLNSRR